MVPGGGGGGTDVFFNSCTSLVSLETDDCNPLIILGIEVSGIGCGIVVDIGVGIGGAGHWIGLLCLVEATISISSSMHTSFLPNLVNFSSPPVLVIVQVMEACKWAGT